MPGEKLPFSVKLEGVEGSSGAWMHAPFDALEFRTKANEGLSNSHSLVCLSNQLTQAGHNVRHIVVLKQANRGDASSPCVQA